MAADYDWQTGVITCDCGQEMKAAEWPDHFRRCARAQVMPQESIIDPPRAQEGGGGTSPGNARTNLTETKLACVRMVRALDEGSAMKAERYKPGMFVVVPQSFPDEVTLVVGNLGCWASHRPAGTLAGGRENLWYTHPADTGSEAVRLYQEAKGGLESAPQACRECGNLEPQVDYSRSDEVFFVKCLSCGSTGDWSINRVDAIRAWNEGRRVGALSAGKQSAAPRGRITDVTAE